MFKCNTCLNDFITEKSLKIHLSKTKGRCEPLKCSFCNKIIRFSSSLERHQSSCKLKKKDKDDINKLNELKEELSKMQEQISNDKQELLKKEAELKDKKIMSEKIDDLYNKYNSGTNQQNTTTNIQILAGQFNFISGSDTTLNLKNIVNRLPCVRTEDLQRLLESADIKKTMDSVDNVTSYLASNYLNSRVICTDKSRHTVAWKDENCEIVKDSKAQKLSNKVHTASVKSQAVLKSKLKNYIDDIDQSDGNKIVDILNKEITHDSLIQPSNAYRNDFSNLFSKRLTKSLKHVDSFQGLPCNTNNNFLTNLDTWLYNYNYNTVFDLLGFLTLFLKYFCKVSVSKTDAETSLLDLHSKKRICWFDKYFAYFLNDSQFIHKDLYYSLIVPKLKNFILSNIKPNAEGNNKAEFFNFSDSDIKTACNEDSLREYLYKVMESLIVK